MSVITNGFSLNRLFAYSVYFLVNVLESITCCSLFSFGVLPLTTPIPVPSNEVAGLQQALDFDSVTPSPTSLPQDYLTMITSAPRSNKVPLVSDLRVGSDTKAFKLTQ